MRIPLSRRYADKACRQLNTRCLRGVSTVSLSSNSATPRLWSGSISFASPEADFVSSSKKSHLSTRPKICGPSWSSLLSFSSPESDFVSASKTEHLREYSTGSTQDSRSESFSFASPESDFVSAPVAVHNSTTTGNNEWSKSFSFAAPESDFVSAPATVHNSLSISKNEWSGSLSFASPESDHVSAPTTVHNSISPVKNEWSESLSFASPESDFVSAPQTVHLSSSAEKNNDDGSIIQDISESHYLYDSPQTATGFISLTEMIDQEVVETLMKKHSLMENLPKTVEDALNDERPIVITTAESPFRVVDVNGAWEGLCGYSRDEAIGCSIGSLLQGPDTDVESANEMVRSLQDNGFSDTVLTNYAKNGQIFENHIQVGMIPAEGHAASSSDDLYFVGVLHDISGNNNEQVAAM